MTLFPKTVPSAVAIRNDPLRRLGLRPECANTGHSLTLWRKGQIDPLLTFPVGPATAASRPIAAIRYEVLLDSRRRPPWCWRPLYAKAGGSFAASVTSSPNPSAG